MNPHTALLPTRLFRLVTRHMSAPPSSLMHPRTEVCPPELWPSSVSWRGQFKRLTNRLLSRATPWLPAPVRPVNRLAMVKSEFQANLLDLPGSSVERLLVDIERARSLRELWHLRSSVYGEVAMALNQAEAERRLTILNRHFPVRAPRSGLMPL